MKLPRSRRKIGRIFREYLRNSLKKRHFFDMDQITGGALGILCNWDCMPHTSRMRQTPRYRIYFVGGPAGSLPGRSVFVFKIRR